MAKGQIAKEEVARKIAAAFGSDYLGEYDKKYYVNAKENGETIQIAISMTCPKNPFPGSGAMDFEMGDAGASPNVESAKPAELTQDELDNVSNLIKALGL